MHMGIAEEEDVILRKEKKSKKKIKNDNGLLNAEAKEKTVEDNSVESKEDDKSRKKREKREKKNKGSCLQDINVSGEEFVGEKDDVGTKREKKRKLDCGLLNAEAKEKTVEDSGVESKEDAKSRKKRGKREKKNKGSCLQDINVSGEKFVGEKDDAGIKREKKRKLDCGLLNAEAKEMTVEDSGVESKEDDKSRKKRQKREKKNKGSCLQDINVSEEEFVGEKDDAGTKREKERKLDCKKQVKEQENEVELVSTKEERKENRKKGEKDVGSYDRVRETPSRKSLVGREVDNESLGLSKDEKESGGAIELKLKDKKKWKKEKKNNSKEGMTASLGEIRNYKEVGKTIEIEVVNNEEEDISVDAEVEEGKKEAKKKKKKKKDKMGGDVESLLVNNFDENSTQDNKRQNIERDDKRNEKSHVDTEIEEGYSIDGAKKEAKKKKKKKKDNVGGDVESLLVNRFDEHSTKDNKSQNIGSDEERNKKGHAERGSNIGSGYSKNRKKERESKNNMTDCSREILEMPVDIENKEADDKGASSNEGCFGSVVKKKRDREKGALHLEMEEFDKSRRKKTKFVKDVKEKGFNEGETKTKNKEENADCSGNPKPKKPSKRVQFSGKVDVFPLPDVSDVGKDNQEGSLVRGKRFSKEEDEIIKTAVLNYVKGHDLGEDGIKKVMHCVSNPETRNCWSEICSAMPWRPRKGIYDRAHILFERAEERSWTSEEYELIKEFHAKHGPKWRMLADEMNKSRIHVKDTWRRICLPQRNKGRWSQEEYQKLFDYVNMDLRMKVFEEKKSQHGMLRDNIAWEAISEKMLTRANADCCIKWYRQLESPLVREGIWFNSDDFRLLNELLSRDYSSVEEVDWDNLLDHRPGDICRKRWNQMVNHLGEHGNKAFADQVEVLSKRYCPDVLEPREIYENKTPVT